MEQLKKKIKYSVIRYSPDELKGEIINVGLLFHDSFEKQVKIFMLDEYSNKLKAILEDETEVSMYKTNKEILEFYLEKSKENLSGIAGNMCIASYYDENFMDKIYEYYEEQSISLSKPNIAYTKNIDNLFKTILKRYIGEKNISNIEKTTTMTPKRYMRKIFSSNENLSKRILSDKIIRPIEELRDLEVKIDFTFKNGRWNYMQTIPKSLNSNKNTEWFSKIQLLLDSDSDKKSKIHLLYKYSDFTEDKATYNLLQYLKSKYENIDIHDVDKESEVNNLCNYIETEGQILEEEAV